MLQEIKLVNKLLCTKQNNLLQFIHYAGGLKPRWSPFHLIWLLCVWVLWN